SRVRAVDLGTGVITTVAGTGGQGFIGDGGAATSALLNGPRGLAIDGMGNLFIADRFAARIRRVDQATGVISTVVGTGEFGFSGDGGAATSATIAVPAGIAFDEVDNLYFADTGNDRIRRVDHAT